MKRFLANEQLEVGLRLAAICAGAALILALINAVTAPTIELNRDREIASNLNRILPVGSRVGEQFLVEDREDIVAYYSIVDESSTPAGYIVQIIGEGYAGDMTLLVGYRRDGEVFAARLLENAETPGVGKLAEEEGYMDRFVGTGTGRTPVPTRKSSLSPEDAAVISGATITFVGISQALREGSRFVQAL